MREKARKRMLMLGLVAAGVAAIPVMGQSTGRTKQATTIRLDPDDIAKAKIQAEHKGLRYQTYLKMLIHEALQREDLRA